MSDFPQEFQEEESICRSMHHLSTAAHHQPSAATKRPSHLSPSSSHEPSSKRVNENPDSSASAEDAAAAGYTKLPLPLPLPLSLPVAPWTFLSRTFSEPIKYTAADNNVQQPSPADNNVPTSSGPALNPPPPSFPFPSLCRTVSDPSPFANHPTPPRPPQARNSSGSPSIGESRSTKWLKRMKELIKEMSEWVNQVVSESDEEDSETENYNTDSSTKDESGLKRMEILLSSILSVRVETDIRSCFLGITAITNSRASESLPEWSYLYLSIQCFLSQCSESFHNLFCRFPLLSPILLIVYICLLVVSLELISFKYILPYHS